MRGFFPPFRPPSCRLRLACPPPHMAVGSPRVLLPCRPVFRAGISHVDTVEGGAYRRSHKPETEIHSRHTHTPSYSLPRHCRFALTSGAHTMGNSSTHAFILKPYISTPEAAQTRCPVFPPLPPRRPSGALNVIHYLSYSPRTRSPQTLAPHASPPPAAGLS